MNVPWTEPFLWIGILIAIEVNRAVYHLAKWLDKRSKQEED